MKIIVASLMVLASGLPAPAAESSFRLGKEEIVVPDPDGFVRVTDDMPAVLREFQRVRDPVNDTLAHYITVEDAALAKSGKLPPFERTCLLKVNKALRNKIIGQKDFADLKRQTKEMNKKTLDKVQSQISGQMGKVSKDLSEEFDLDIALKISNVIPQDPHYEEDHALAFSMFIDFGIAAGGATAREVVAATSTFVNAGGVVLFLYSYAPKADLEATRATSKSWAESVMASNAAPPRRSSGEGKGWMDSILGKAVIWGVAGAMIALVVSAVSGMKKRNA